MQRLFFSLILVILGLSLGRGQTDRTGQPYSLLGRVYVSGQVNSPGVVELRSDEALTVSKAIILRGGLNAFADSQIVRLVRDVPGEKSQITTIDVARILEGTAQDPAVQAGDMIEVPEKPKKVVAPTPAPYDIP